MLSVWLLSRFVQANGQGNGVAADEVVQVLISDTSPSIQINRACGPRAAISSAVSTVANGCARGVLVEQLRIQAIMDSAKRSHPRIIAGIRAWISFADHILGMGGRDLPPSVSGLVAFSGLFNNAGTFSNYVSSIAFACAIAGVPDTACKDSLVRRAKRAVMSRQGAPKIQRSIQRPLLRDLMDLASREGDRGAAVLYGLSYAFMLRIPSEGFPLTFSTDAISESPSVSNGLNVLQVHGLDARLHFFKRKNRPHGSSLDRRCWCHVSPSTCPVHLVSPWVHNLEKGVAPFAGYRAGDMRVDLRRRLSILGVQNVDQYNLKSFRRGHAEDMAESARWNRCDLYTILKGGDWSSAAYNAYLDSRKLEKEAVRQTTVFCDSSDSEAAEEFGA